jgi:hypothetical protein
MIYSNSHLLTLFSLLTFLPLALTWGPLGHRTVAYLAQNHLTPDGAAYVSYLLNGSDISDGAVWPDWYKNTPAGWKTRGWHYIHAHDDPPNRCGVRYARDCGGNDCAVAAVGNLVSCENVASPGVYF